MLTVIVKCSDAAPKCQRAWVLRRVFCPRLRHPEVINGRWAHQAPLAANRHRAKVSRVSTMPTAEGGRGQGSGTHLRLPHSRPRVGAHGPGLATGFHEVAAAWGPRGGDFGEG